MATTRGFAPGTGILTTTGDGLDNAITTSRDAARHILVNAGGVPMIHHPAQRCGLHNEPIGPFLSRSGEMISVCPRLEVNDGPGHNSGRAKVGPQAPVGKIPQGISWKSSRKGPAVCNLTASVSSRLPLRNWPSAAASH